MDHANGLPVGMSEKVTLPWEWVGMGNLAGWSQDDVDLLTEEYQAVDGLVKQIANRLVVKRRMRKEVADRTAYRIVAAQAIMGMKTVERSGETRKFIKGWLGPNLPGFW